MTTPPADLVLIDAFEKMRAYLLEADPTLEAGPLAPSKEPLRWQELPDREYQEIFLAVGLGIDRRTAAGRRAVHHQMGLVRAHAAGGQTGRVAEGSRPSHRSELFRIDGRERWFRRNLTAIARALDSLAADKPKGPPPLIREIVQCQTRRDAVARLRKRMPLLGGLRAYEFLEQIGYPMVLPDPPRQRLFQRLGWLERVAPTREFPQAFFEVCERLVHLTGGAWAVLDAATGLFAGSRSERGASAVPLAVCTARPRCGKCVLNAQCAYYRYRGEPEPLKSRSVKYMAYSEQPRTRFEALGSANLSEAELLALVLRTGSQGKSSLDLAREILERFASLEALANAGLGEICQIKGVGRAKAIEIKAALELGRRLLQGGPVAVGEPIRRSADIYEAYRGLLEIDQQENFYLVVLNTRNRIQNHFLISRGSLTGSPVHPREVIKVAIREAAAAIIFVHNHPSGEPEPSHDDHEITERLVKAARLVGIRVLDHVIIGRDRYFSFADHHLLEPE